LAVTPEEAVRFVVDEGLGEQGIVVMVRMGDDPGPQRMAKLIEAVQILFRELRNRSQLDRKLVYALFGLAIYVPTNLDPWCRTGRSWRKELVEQEQCQLLESIESIFADVL